MDLLAMIRAHAAWKGRLFESLSGGEPVDRAVASADDRCQLGAWMAAEGRERCGGDPHWDLLVERHRAFHQAVGAVLDLVAQGRRQEAVERLFAGAYDTCTHEVVAAMIAVHESCGKQRDA